MVKNQVKLYSEPNFKGDVEIIVFNTPNLNVVKFNDKAQSIKVEGSESFVFGEHGNFLKRGYVITLAPGDYDVADLSKVGIATKTLSSVKPFNGRSDEKPKSPEISEKKEEAKGGASPATKKPKRPKVKASAKPGEILTDGLGRKMQVKKVTSRDSLVIAPVA